MGWFRKKQHQHVRQPKISESNEAYAFRRSRTLTGSLSSNVHAAAESTADLQSNRLKHHTLRRKRRSLALYWLATIGVVVGLWLFLGQFFPSVRISTSEVVALPPSQGDDYKKHIEVYLASHPFERFSFSLNNATLLRSLQDKYSEIQQVKLEPGALFQPANATVTLRRPIASWTLGTSKYYIDNQGTAFQRHQGDEPSLVVEDLTGIDPAQAGAVASERTIRFIGRLVSLLEKQGYKVEKVMLPPNTSRQIDIHITGKVYTIKTSLDRDPAGQVTDVVNAIKFLDSKDLTPEYVDVRVSSRMYYK